jgi:hypothetical protein
MGAMMQCTFGAAPSSLVLTPANRVNAGTMSAGTRMDHIPMTNVMPFGMCSAPTNPQVSAATAAAAGVLTPQPCIPATSSPWLPGSPTVNIGGKAALNSTCKLMCQWLGTISITNPGQATVNVP